MSFNSTKKFGRPGAAAPKLKGYKTFNFSQTVHIFEGWQADRTFNLWDLLGIDYATMQDIYSNGDAILIKNPTIADGYRRYNFGGNERTVSIRLRYRNSIDQMYQNTMYSRSESVQWLCGDNSDFPVPAQENIFLNRLIYNGNAARVLKTYVIGLSRAGFEGMEDCLLNPSTLDVSIQVTIKEKYL